MNPFYFYLALVLISDIAAIISAKYYSLNHNPLFMLGAIVGFAFTGLFFCKTVLYEGSAIANVIWSALSTIIISLIGYFYFKENISLLQGIGIGIIVIGLVLVNIK